MIAPEKVRGAEVLARLERLIERGKARLGPLWLIFPAASLVYGLVSGWMLTRDYAHSRHLLAAMGILLGGSIVARIWLSQESGGARQVKGPRDLAHGAVLFATRFVIQYIVAFCIPLLALAGAWFTLVPAVILGALTFSKSWWDVCSRWNWFEPLGRSFTLVLATSFSFVVFFPDQLTWFYPVLAGVAIIAAFPWAWIQRYKLPPASAFGPMLIVSTIVAAQVVTKAWIRFPPLALWLRSPALGVEMRGLTLVDVWDRQVPLAIRDAALTKKQDICCLTPVVSPRGVRASVVHEWLADDRVIDRIVLPPVQGMDDHGKAAFRTYSCKRALPADMITLECRAYLDGSLYLGNARIRFSP